MTPYGEELERLAGLSEHYADVFARCKNDVMAAYNQGRLFAYSHALDLYRGGDDGEKTL